jgi:enoyl-CoA hydratase/carnithine racemase
MVERAQDLVKIDVSGLVFRGCFKDAFMRRFPVVDLILNIPEIVQKARGEAGIAIHPITTGPVLLSLNANVATITLDRPDNGNRVDGEMTDALGEACRLISEDDGLRLVVLTGNGNVFSIDDGSAPTGNPGAHVAGLAVPVLVALNGDATGPGLELALAGDLRICVPSARFGFPGLVSGVIPQHGGTQRLPRLVGPSWARDMLLTGRMVDAKEALSIGLVNRVADGPGQLTATVADLTAQIVRGSPLGARYAKEAVGKGMDLSLDQGLKLEADLNIILQSTSDRTEGIKSFLEKRGPEFTGS